MAANLCVVDSVHPSLKSSVPRGSQDWQRRSQFDQKIWAFNHLSTFDSRGFTFEIEYILIGKKTDLRSIIFVVIKLLMKKSNVYQLLWCVCLFVQMHFQKEEEGRFAKRKPVSRVIYPKNPTFDF